MTYIIKDWIVRISHEKGDGLWLDNVNPTFPNV